MVPDCIGVNGSSDNYVDVSNLAAQDTIFSTNKQVYNVDVSTSLLTASHESTSTVELTNACRHNMHTAAHNDGGAVDTDRLLWGRLEGQHTGADVFDTANCLFPELESAGADLLGQDILTAPGFESSNMNDWRMSSTDNTLCMPPVHHTSDSGFTIPALNIRGSPGGAGREFGGLSMGSEGGLGITPLNLQNMTDFDLAAFGRDSGPLHRPAGVTRSHGSLSPGGLSTSYSGVKEERDKVYRTGNFGVAHAAHEVPHPNFVNRSAASTHQQGVSASIQSVTRGNNPESSSHIMYDTSSGAVQMSTHLSPDSRLLCTAARATEPTPTSTSIHSRAAAAPVRLSPDVLLAPTQVDAALQRHEQCVVTQAQQPLTRRSRTQRPGVPPGTEDQNLGLSSSPVAGDNMDPPLQFVQVAVKRAKRSHSSFASPSRAGDNNGVRKGRYGAHSPPDKPQRVGSLSNNNIFGDALPANWDKPVGPAGAVFPAGMLSPGRSLPGMQAGRHKDLTVTLPTGVNSTTWGLQSPSKVTLPSPLSTSTVTALLPSPHMPSVPAYSYMDSAPSRAPNPSHIRSPSPAHLADSAHPSPAHLADSAQQDGFTSHHTHVEHRYRTRFQTKDEQQTNSIQSASSSGAEPAGRAGFKSLSSSGASPEVRSPLRRTKRQRVPVPAAPLSQPTKQNLHLKVQSVSSLPAEHGVGTRRSKRQRYTELSAVDGEDEREGRACPSSSREARSMRSTRVVTVVERGGAVDVPGRSRVLSHRVITAPGPIPSGVFHVGPQVGRRDKGGRVGGGIERSTVGGVESRDELQEVKMSGGGEAGVSGVGGNVKAQVGPGGQTSEETGRDDTCTNTRNCVSEGGVKEAGKALIPAGVEAEEVERLIRILQQAGRGLGPRERAGAGSVHAQEDLDRRHGAGRDDGKEAGDEDRGAEDAVLDDKDLLGMVRFILYYLRFNQVDPDIVDSTDLVEVVIPLKDHPHRFLAASAVQLLHKLVRDDERRRELGLQPLTTVKMTCTGTKKGRCAPTSHQLPPLPVKQGR